METTVGIVRYAPFNAIAIMLGANVGRPGILTQCAVEEATELDLGMRGYTAYAETVSVYGTEDVFMDGDDTPWSKAFLASCYASRGVKMRFTSGTGSEVQMGMAEGKFAFPGRVRGAGELLCPGAFDVVREGLSGLGAGNSECGFCLLGTLFPGKCGRLCVGDESHLTHERVCPCV